MRAIIYSRVSTADQLDRGFSIPTQIEACQKYAADQNMTVVCEVTDDFTGTKLDRPGLNRVRGMIERREADAVIVYSTDRLTRKLAHVLILREEWNRAGVELHYVRRGKSEDTPESRMMENIEGVFNEYWREKIVESARRGMHGKAQKGKVVGIGPSLYGYRYKDGSYEIAESEARVVRLIYQWYTVGEESNKRLSIWAISKKLSQMGIPTPGERIGRPRKRKPGSWNGVIIARILENETYNGTWHWGKNIGAGGRGGRRSLAEQIAIKVPPIIDRTTWEAAQAQRKYNKAMAKRNTKHEYLLRGMVSCGCQRAMIGHTRTSGTFYYRCSSNYYYIPGVENRTCKERSTRGQVLEAIVWEYILGLITSDARQFEDALRKAQQDEKAAIQPKQDQLEFLSREIATRREEAERLVAVLESTKGELMSLTIQERISSLERQYAALVREHKLLAAELSQHKTLSDEDVDAAMEFRRDVTAGMKNPTFEDKRRILEALRIQVTVQDAKATVRCCIPTSPRSLELHTSTSCLRCRRLSQPRGADA